MELPWCTVQPLPWSQGRLFQQAPGRLVHGPGLDAQIHLPRLPSPLSLPVCFRHTNTRKAIRLSFPKSESLSCRHDLVTEGVPVTNSCKWQVGRNKAVMEKKTLAFNPLNF